MSEDQFDIVVAGAGIAGAAAAYELASEARVLLVEAEDQPGYHATGRSEALYEPLYGGAVGRSLAAASLPFFRAPPVGFGDRPLIAPRGALYFAEPGDEPRLAELTALAAGRRLERLVASEALARAPLLRPDSVAAAVYDPDVADIDVHALHQGYLAGLRRRGGELRIGAPVTMIRDAGTGFVVETSAGRVRTPIFINAAGAWADRIAQMAGVRQLGHRPLRRTVIVIDVPSGLPHDAPHMEAVGDGAYFKPESGALLMSPADEILSAPCDAQPDEMDVALAADRLERLTTLSVRRIRRRWAGLRTMSPDRAPVIGPDPQRSGFFWLTGLGGVGVSIAPAAGRAAAALILEGRLPQELSELDPAALSPSRFGIA